MQTNPMFNKTKDRSSETYNVKHNSTTKRSVDTWKNEIKTKETKIQRYKLSNKLHTNTFCLLTGDRVVLYRSMTISISSEQYVRLMMIQQICVICSYTHIITLCGHSTQLYPIHFITHRIN